LDEAGKGKIHKCCKITDIDDHSIFSDALELHYIDMEAFVKTINEAGCIGKGEMLDSMFEKWLAVITEKDIKDKTIIKNICGEQEEIGMVVSELVRLSEEMIIRHAYQRRQDDIVVYNRFMDEWKEDKRIMEEQEKEIARLRHEIEELQAGK
jgi:hypothetical protein